MMLFWFILLILKTFPALWVYRVTLSLHIVDTLFFLNALLGHEHYEIFSR